MDKDIRIIVIDGCELFRYGLQCMLEQEEDMQVVGDYANAEDALPQVRLLSPDIVLMDAHLPGMNGIQATRRLRKNELHRDIDVIILADCAYYLAEAWEAGATDYLLQDVTRTELTQAIRSVYLSKSKQPSENFKSFVEEAVELVIPPSPNVEAARLLRFLCQVEEILNDNYNSITRVVGSWDSGITVTLTLPAKMLGSILDKLAEMPNIKAVEEEPLIKEAVPRLLKEFGILQRTCTSPRKRIRITLKKSRMAKQGTTTMLN